MTVNQEALSRTIEAMLDRPGMRRETVIAVVNNYCLNQIQPQTKFEQDIWWAYIEALISKERQ